jgi:hypothetical protein
MGIMKITLDEANATLPDPISSSQVNFIAETILRTAKEGERDPSTLQRMALLELQSSRENDASPFCRACIVLA